MSAHSLLHTRPIRSFLAALSMLLACDGSAAYQQDFSTDTPIMDFRLPLFAQSGYKGWEIAGHEGRYLGDNRILVLLMSIKVFSGDAAMRLETVISSPDATIEIQEKRADSESSLLVEGEDYRVRGRNWSWYGNEQRILIREDAEVAFAQSLGNILRSPTY